MRPSYEFGPFRLDPAERRLTRDGRSIALTPKAFDVLRVLVENAGHLVRKESLLSQVWPDNFVEEGALNRSVSVIRKTLGETAERRYVETVPKSGYRFIAPVTRYESPLPAVMESKPTKARIPSSAFAIIATVLVTLGGLAILMLRGVGQQPVAPAETAAQHRQVTFTGKEGTPTLSPDGGRIAYVSSEEAGKRVLVQQLDGGAPVTILAAPEAGHLRWSPDGSELLVWARGGGYDGIYIVAQAGGMPRLVAPRMYIGCWSPDGTTIAIPSYLGGRIWFVNGQGVRQRSFALTDVTWSIWDIDWSPVTGLLTLASSDPEGRFTLWTVRADGTEQTRILTERTAIHSARWAPDGRAIYYLRELNQTHSLYKVSIRGDSTADSASLLTGLETDQSFAISSDGTRLVYARAPYHSNLWALELAADGRAATRALTQGTALVERPHISPDGQSIAFNIGHEPTANVYTMPIGGGQPRQLTFFNSFNLTGGWSADGTSIVFASTQGGKPRVWRVGTGGGPPYPLSTGNMSESLNVSWFPGRTILYQQAGNQNYYRLDPVTAKEGLFVANGTRGWMFSPVTALDGRRVAVMWNRPPDRGIWVIDTVDHVGRLIYRSAADWTVPIGWSADGGAIYALEGKTLTLSRGLAPPLGETLTDATIVQIPLSGNPRTIIALPSQETGGVSMTPDGRTFVYAAYTSRSDVWVVDNFDASLVKQISRK